MLENDRSAITKARIADAVVQIIAEFGLGKLTHRRVASASGLSLATTTYYYATKQDMVADASARLLDGYVNSFRMLAERQRKVSGVSSLTEIATKLLLNSAGRYRISGLAWCEIILDAARTPDGHQMARKWFDDLLLVWRDLAVAINISDVDNKEVYSAVDAMIGLLFLTMPLGLTPDRIADVLSNNKNIEEVWKPEEVTVGANKMPLRRTKKAQETRLRIIDAVIHLLIDGGTSAVTYNAIAQVSGMTVAAPAYHFGSIATLLECAEASLFARSKDRYRDIRTTLPQQEACVEDIADLTTAILVREATQHGLYAVAIFSIWLEAARQPKLRREIWEAILDMSEAWTRRIATVHPAASLVDGWRAQAIYIGRIVRILATGTPPAALEEIRGLFLHDLQRDPGQLL